MKRVSKVLIAHVHMQLNYDKHGLFNDSKQDET